MAHINKRINQLQVPFMHNGFLIINKPFLVEISESMDIVNN